MVKKIKNYVKNDGWWDKFKNKGYQILIKDRVN